MLTSFLATIMIILMDQFVKILTISHLSPLQFRPLVPGIFQWTYIQNEGASWGILAGQRNLFIVITLCVVGYLGWLIYQNRKGQLSLNIAYGLMLGGAIGNLIDRIYLGYVIDMIQLTFIEFPIFNIADMALCIGVFMIALHLLKYRAEEDLV